MSMRSGLHLPRSMNCCGFAQFTVGFKSRAPWRKSLEVETGSVLFLLPVCMPGGVANRGLTVGKHSPEGEQLRVGPKKFIKISNRSKKATKRLPVCSVFIHLGMGI
jgi:hypothetical protein